MSELYQSLSHSKWDGKYHVAFVPKRRRKAIFGQTRRHLGQIFHAAFWVAVDGFGNAYVVGDTESDQTTFPNGNGFGSLPGLLGPDQTLNGGFDAFVAKIADPPAWTGSSFGFPNQNVVGAPLSEAPSILYQDHLWKGRQIPK